MHLSLSLSLSCPSSAPRLTAPSRRFLSLFARHGSPRPASCSKLPCHAQDDVRRPQAVTRDRSLAYTLTIGRQAHREWTCRAPGGVAGQHDASFSPRALVYRGRGGVVSNTRPALCSKLPCHAHTDVRRPQAVTRDRSLAYTLTFGRQAHCERTCRAPGGVAGQLSLTSLPCALVSRAPAGVAEFNIASSLSHALVSRAPGGAAEPQGASFSYRASSRSDRFSKPGQASAGRRRRHPHLATVREEAPTKRAGRSLIGARRGRCAGRRGLNPRPRRPRASFRVPLTRCRKQQAGDVVVPSDSMEER